MVSAPNADICPHRYTLNSYLEFNNLGSRTGVTTRLIAAPDRPQAGNLKRRPLRFRPNSQRSPQIHQLRQMIGVVVRKHQRLLKNCLTIAMRNLRE